MQFGSIKSIVNGSADVEVYYEGGIVKMLRQYTSRVRVADSQEEMSEYLKFSDDMRAKRAEGKLEIGTDQRDYTPKFELAFPKNKGDGGYFVIKTWTELA